MTFEFTVTWDHVLVFATHAAAFGAGLVGGAAGILGFMFSGWKGFG